MKKFVTILLVVALYAPVCVQIATYTQCRVSAASDAEKGICDCMLQKDNTSNTPIDKHDHRIIKVDWQYEVTSLFHINRDTEIIESLQKHQSFYLLQIPTPHTGNIFHPPAC